MGYAMQNTNQVKLRNHSESEDNTQSQKHHTKTTLVSRNITVNDKRTSVRLEPEMWNALRDIAKREGCSIHDICSLIALRKNENTSLTAAIRVFLMLYFRAASTEEGHIRAGHGNFSKMLNRARLKDTPVQRFKNHVQAGVQNMNGYNREAAQEQRTH